MIRLRRLFAQADRGGRVSLSNTPDVCRDLEWLAERYPLKFDPRAALTAQANKHRERQAMVDDLLAGVRAPQKIDLALPPRDYQRVAADMLVGTSRYILGDDLGLGKTVSAIAAMVATGATPVLVVTMTHLVRQWDREVKKYAPRLTTHVIKTGKLYDYTAQRGRKGQGRLFNVHPDVLIINYHKLANWCDTLGAVCRFVVFDECQELRGGTKTQKGQGAKGVSNGADYVMGLSATPFYNRGGEFWNVMDIIKPDSLGSFQEFYREWCCGFEDKAVIKDPSAFGAYLRDAGLFLRRTRADVKRELPELTVVTHEVESDTEALEAIAASATNLAKLILDKAERRDKGDAMRASGELDMLVRQATGVAKAPYVAEFVRLLLDSEERVVLFGWHHAVYDIWKERLKDFNPAMYTGDESAAQKEASVQAFVSGESRVLIVSLRAGAGLDGLQHVCRTGVFGELDWSPAVHEQAGGRLHRDQQKEPVVLYYLMSNEGSDPIVADILGVKRDQIEGVRNPNRDVLGTAHVDPERVKKLAQKYLSKNANAA
jgi:SNF2 family DNA or RNA helicase